MTEIAWAGIESPSVERCRITEGVDGVRVVSTVEGGDAGASYELTADGRWHFRTLTLRCQGRELHVSRGDQGWSVNGEQRADLAAAREVDISISPLSNTLPIRRLGLAVGQSEDIVTAYITVPDLVVTTDPQRYTRLSEDEYLYESRDSSFSRTVLVDAEGLVIDYPGLFQRVPPAASEPG